MFWYKTVNFYIFNLICALRHSQYTLRDYITETKANNSAQ